MYCVAKSFHTLDKSIICGGVGLRKHCRFPPGVLSVRLVDLSTRPLGLVWWIDPSQETFN